MKRIVKLLFIMFIGLIFLPFNVKADTYKSLDFVGALKEEKIEQKFKNYKPKDDAITIYLFRGKGCGYCRAYLEFMNDITDEYGKYFKMESYEVWNNADNKKLMNDVSSFLGQSASGVPYIIIGDKVFGGYNESYNDAIKEAIKKLYDTKKNKRYDVFKEMKKQKTAISTTTLFICNLVIIVVSSIAMFIYFNSKIKELSSKIEEMSKVTKKEHKKK